MDISFLRREFGDRFIEDKVVASLYIRDASFIEVSQSIIGVVFPEDEEEVVELVRWAVRNKTPLFPQGCATSLSGNAIATTPGLVVSFERMAKVEIDPIDGVAVAGPGVKLEELNIELARHGLFFPVDPGSVKSATVGGAIANGAGGMRGAKYGTMKDWVLGLRVVTGRGDTLKLGCRTYKCRNGYDLVRLFVGSEGTLGLVTEATLKLAPIPESATAVLAYYNDVETLVEDVVKVRANRVWPLFAEFLDAPTSALVGLEEKNALFLGVDVNTGAEERLLKKLRELIRGEIAQEAAGWEAAMKLLEPRRKLFYGQITAARGGVLVIEDIAVPISKLPDAVRGLKAVAAKHGVPLLLGGHVGDGNLHPATWYRREEGPAKVEKFIKDMAELVAKLNGTISAEHGVGILKKELARAELGETTLSYMRELKKLFDPYNILNPGKIF
ncbi:D-lactate dehydrogenase (cytochrome) [Pyrobaculum islandicum DSM 4184]|uniref:D-lactate dehydrogenase (cytochrome) n=1 Tax=Pyrobaculum islandicum (strain DSM 4184 / JCM 9189 / GEO3) TaxID=384616 RepID=A1RVK3_PYRIL|nr:FAD-linked oxidase C-terminal domain-containing protein [Pyrobaculum islandicum]ABL88985.1 D-lactate dehydrogenase (cytochrome) [Pyrobaculum islandicum DSM 4184]